MWPQLLLDVVVEKNDKMIKREVARRASSSRRRSRKTLLVDK
jgi:hypothetical protein